MLFTRSNTPYPAYPCGISPVKRPDMHSLIKDNDDYP